MGLLSFLFGGKKPEKKQQKKKRSDATIVREYPEPDCHNPYFTVEKKHSPLTDSALKELFEHGFILQTMSSSPYEYYSNCGPESPKHTTTKFVYVFKNKRFFPDINTSYKKRFIPEDTHDVSPTVVKESELV